MAKAYWINAKLGAVIPCEINSLEEMQEKVGGLIDLGCVLITGDTVYVDEEGLLKNDLTAAFGINPAIVDGTDGSERPSFMGNGLVLSVNRSNGENADAIIRQANLEQALVFVRGEREKNGKGFILSSIETKGI